MNTATVAINGDATLCAPGDHPPKVAKKAAHRRCIFSMGVVQSWYRRDTALQCPRRFGVLPRGPCVLLTSETAKTARQSPAADDGLPSADKGLSVVDDGPTPPVDGGPTPPVDVGRSSPDAAAVCCLCAAYLCTATANEACVVRFPLCSRASPGVFRVSSRAPLPRGAESLPLRTSHGSGKQIYTRLRKLT